MREHGTHACYVHGPNPGSTPGGCRCADCSLANSLYERDRQRGTAPAYVGATRARNHIEELRQAGVGLKTIAKRAGVSHGALSKLIYGDRTRGRGPSKRIRQSTEAAILAVTPADAAPGGKIPASRTWDHIGTLLARGWTKTAIARAIGQTSGGLQLSHELVSKANADAVAALLDQPVPPRHSRWGVVEPPEPDDDGQDEVEERRFVHDLPQLPPEPDDTDWLARGACRINGVPTWVFFPARGDTKTTTMAKACCETCSVAADCLAYAETVGLTDGIFGGLTARQRRERRWPRTGAA